MDFDTVESIRDAGFRGFVRVSDLQESCDQVPRQRGVYLVLRGDIDPPTFLNVNPAGRFRDKDPTVPLDRLEREWVNGALVLYIGQAGGGDSHETLRDRIRSLVRYASGLSVAHYGGRLLWQVEGSGFFLVCWRPEGCADPKAQEGRLIQAFGTIYGDRPFANLCD